MHQGEKPFHPVTGKTRNRRLDEKAVRELKPSIEFGTRCDVVSTGNFNREYSTLIYCTHGKTEQPDWITDVYKKTFKKVPSLSLDP
jgi:hypothetical protein